ncbi:MAG: methyltransferase domain-containing protein [Pedosphaera parvula]|nr:methyltransferase domain-containing protein [Pedosphaera parvula]
MQAEYFDLPGRAKAETLEAFQNLDRLNRLFIFSRPFEDVLPGWLGQERCARLDILDIGAGTGLLGQMLCAWAAKRGWDWRCTNLDTNLLGLTMGNAPRLVLGSALELPFADGSFDVVLASQMTHHLTDEQVTSHLREAWRVTRDALMISDLHRNPGLYALLWLATLTRTDKSVRADALLSVKRGFKLGELRALAEQAGVANASVRLFYGTRVLMKARQAHG